jgi:hypothetical protein
MSAQFAPSRLIAIAAITAAAPAHAETDSGAAPPETARANRDEFSLGATMRALRSSSANALTGANLAGGSLGLARDIGHDLGLALRPDLSLWIEAGVATGAANGTMFQSLSTTINAIDLTAGVAARYRLLRRVTASARLAVGAQRARVAIDVPGVHTYDHGWGAMASAAARLDVLALARPRFGLGVRFEAGYVAAQSIALTPHPEENEGTIELAMVAASLGHLDLSGPTFTVSLLGQF